MSDIENHLKEVKDEPARDDERAGLLSQIQDLHSEVREDHWLDLPIPGYRNLLWARFRPFAVEKMESKMPQLRRDAKAGLPILLASSIQTLIDSLQELMLLPARHGGGTDQADIGEKGVNLIPIDPDALPRIGFDERLVPLFKLTPVERSAAGVVKALFPTEQSITAMNVRVSQWMQDVTREINDDLLGE